MCERSLRDATFPKYPRLPVRQCRGYEPIDENCPKEPEREK